MVTALEAVQKALNTKTWAPDMCDNFVANMYGYEASGYNTALEHWNSLPAYMKSPANTMPPAGALVFWDGGQGHVALSLGKEDIVSTDWPKAGIVSKTTIDAISVKWGKNYLGWSQPEFQGQEHFVMLHGVDVASYQGANPDFTKCDVVAIKVTEGLSYTNPEFGSQLDDARAHGCRVVFYHYPHIADDVIQQVDYFLSQIGTRLVDNDVLCLDWEWYGQNVTDQQARDFKDNFLHDAKSKKRNKVVVYSDVNNWRNVDSNSNAGDGLWIADYDHPAGQPSIQHPWFGHQYADRPEDQDVWNFPDIVTFDRWAKENVTPPPTGNGNAEMYSASFEVNAQGGGIHFAEGIAKNVSFFCDNTLLLGESNVGVDLRVVVWSDTPDSPHVQTVRVSNHGSKETTIDFANAAKTFAVTVTRADSNTIPVYGEVSG
ncbi:MAG TPA: glycoside hydrolase family 25 protein [Bryobacteraceae bacterium]